MIQVHQPHQPGTFPRCPGCGKEPLHIVSVGTSTADTSTSAPTHRHHIECPRCRERTAAYATFALAQAEWQDWVRHTRAALHVTDAAA